MALVALSVWVPLALAARSAPSRASAVAPSSVQAPKVLGTVQEGQVLRVDPGKWQGTTPITFRFQWQVCSASGLTCADVQNQKATDRIYAVRTADVGKSIRVVVTASNQIGSASAPSQATATVIAAPPTNPRNTQIPSILGTPREGQVLAAQPGTWTAPTGPIRFMYQWRICDSNGGACQATKVTTRTYTLHASDGGHSFRVLVRAWTTTIRALSPARTSAALSDPTAVVSAVVGPPGAPVNVSAPTINGKAQVGELLTGHTGDWRGTQPITFHYQWQRCDQNGQTCITLVGATQNRLKLEAKDVGHRMRVLITAANRAGRTQALSGSSDIVKTGSAASPKPPENTSPPTISGTPQEGHSLVGHRGSWSGNSTDYNDFWVRCDKTGNSCSNISGATDKNGYLLKSLDVGNTLRFKVQARNANGSSFASSVPTAIIAAATAPPPPPPPPSATGCPTGTGTIQVANLKSPARLLIDAQQASPSVVHRGSQQIILRYHVSACGGRSVQGALVYATATPYNQLSSPGEQTTGSDGYAELSFHTLAGFPVSPHQQLLAMFVRARKSGEDLLGGISTRRLFAVPVSLNG